MKEVVNFVVNGEKWKEAQDKSFQKLNSKAKIDGFRPGKAPRSVFEKKYGSSEIIMDAADKLIQDRYAKMIIEDKLVPILEPKVEILRADEEELDVTITVIEDSVPVLGEYKNLGVKKDKVEVKKEEIDKRVNDLLKDYAELVVKEGTIESGNIAIIDFEGFKDGVAFDGGKAENYSLEIGSNTFIPGFEDGIIGMKNGEEKDLELTFPEDYGAEELNGAKVVFKVKVNEIKERVIPTLDKEFFDDLGMENITNEEELRNEIEKEIKEEKEKTAENKYVDALLEKASSNMKVELEDEMIDAEALRMYDDFMQRMSMQGINEDIYLKYANTTKDDIVNHMRIEAARRITNRYLLEAIIEKEKLETSIEEANKEAEDMAKKYNMTTEDLLKSIGGIEMLKYDMTMRKAIDVMKG